MTLIEDEEGAETVDKLLRQADSGSAVALASFISYKEVFYITLQEKGKREADKRLALMEALPVLRVESSRSLGIAAGKLKARRRLSLADAWIAALALETGAALVHKDPDFDEAPELQKIVRLPLKTSTRTV